MHITQAKIKLDQAILQSEIITFALNFFLHASKSLFSKFVTHPTYSASTNSNAPRILSAFAPTNFSLM